MNVYVSHKYTRSFKKLVKKNLLIGKRVREKIELLINNPASSSLKLHKLSGLLVNEWSISITEDMRLIFKYEEDGILLINIGKHEDVY